MTLAGPRVRYVARRLVQAVPTVLGIITCAFLLLHLAPGDAASVLAGASGAASADYVAQLREQFGLDRSLLLQYGDFVLNILRLDLGYSFAYGVSNAGLIVGRLGATMLLMTGAFAIATAVGTTLGLLAAARRGRLADYGIRLFAVVAYAAPLFWVALMLIVLFALHWQLLPVSGMEQVASGRTGIARALDIAHHLVLPAGTLSLFYMATYARIMRASVIDQLGLNYVVTARAKGVPGRRILWGHVFRNAVLPLITMAGLQIGSMLGGSIVIESIFGWPGLGLLAFEAMFARDLNLLLAILMLSSVLVVVVNLVIDVSYTFVDPRIELR